MTPEEIQHFIDVWSRSGGAERSNYQLFLTGLCDILEVPRPDPSVPDNDENAYVFERSVAFINPEGPPSTKFIDLYKRGCFVLETKQGVEKDDAEQLLSAAGQERAKRRKKGHGVRGSTAWNDTLLRARGQAEQYARALAAPETRPPFLVVVDVGHTIDLYSEFTQTGGTYIHFPDASSHRIKLADLANPDTRSILRAVWLDPLSLDPARRSAKATRAIAAKLAQLAKSLEAEKHEPHDVAQFLMRCLFTMFAEDIGLLSDKAAAERRDEQPFKDLLAGITDTTHFKPVVEDLWQKMNVGGFSVQFRRKLLKFNGGLFYDPSALPLNRDQIDLLIDAAKLDWRDVEPAIFGTLLERALDPVERHKLGAHYTPRAYVERLVIPTIVEPIRKEWDAVRTAAILHAQQGQRDEAVKELEAFHDKLCDIKVLDPACGSGNFLYVTLEHLKRIEGEVFSTYQSIAERQTLLESGHTVDPHQLLGIEINPRAAAIADIVLWIGYLQWHFRTRGNVNPPEPVIKNFKNIECRDALLIWTSREPLLDENGKPVTHWDGRTTKSHPVTGEEVPDESAREISYKYNDPKKAQWPKADYAVGNPPFIGNKKMRSELGDGYVEALRSAFGNLPETIDYVMYWWDTCADLTLAGQLKQFGLITTNSITQTFNRGIVREYINATSQLSILFAVPDHPWVDSADGANVRIAMTCVGTERQLGRLQQVISENSLQDESGVSLTERSGIIHSDLTVGADLRGCTPLKANRDLCLQGCKLVGAGFAIDARERGDLIRHQNNVQSFLPRYVTGSDLMKSPDERYVIDFYGFGDQDARARFPAGFQIILDRVKPERDQNRRETRKRNWWLFGENAPKLRRSCKGLKSFIATSEVSKHRIFTTLSLPEHLADGSLAAIASDDAYILGVLSNRIHVCWAFNAGGRMGKGNDPRYQNGPCFDPYPFPDATQSQKSRIRELGEQLDAHRKRQQAQHPRLTMTGMYNVLEKLRAGEALNAKEQEIHEQGLVSVLRQIHDDLDAAVADAYGWPADLTDEAILERLVALNHERAEEERRGIIRYLRPDFQNPAGQKQSAIPLPDREGPGEGSTKGAKTKKTKAAKLTWPKTLSEQAGAVHTTLVGFSAGATAEEIAKTFGRATAQRVERIEEILETLAALGKARELTNDRYIAM